MLNTPILFVIFNREDTALRVFSKIREAQPKKLYLAADGPRQTRQGEREKCLLLREKILKGIDWPCQVKTLFREKNLGCGRAVSGAITWLFDNEESGIILEDDCLPGSDFFLYAQDLLERYKDNEKIKIISGDNFQQGRKIGSGSYYFSSTALIWGWATWRRVWKEYEFDISPYSLEELKSFYKPYSFGIEDRLYWSYRAKQMQNHRVDTWDYQLHFSIWRKKGMNIVPGVNLIENIGFGSDATHTAKQIEGKNKIVKSEEILPLKYNDLIIQDKAADKFYHDTYNGKALWKYPILFAKLWLEVKLNKHKVS